MGRIWKFKMNVPNLIDEELEFCQRDTEYSSYPVMIKIEGVAVDMGLTDDELCLRLFQAKDVEEMRDIPELSEKIWEAFDLLNELESWRFAGSNYYNLEIPERKKEYEAKAKDSLVFDAADLKQSQVRSAELFRTLVSRKLEESNTPIYDYLDP